MNNLEKYEIGIIGRCMKYFIEHKLNKNFKRIKVSTPYGTIDRIYVGNIYGKKVAILDGRFDNDRYPSYKINFKAMIFALKSIGVSNIIGTYIVGSVKDFDLSTIILPNDYIVYGSTRETFFENGNYRSSEMFQPFCPELRKIFIKASHSCRFKVIRKGIYCCFHQPRIETNAEINLFKKIGVDIVGQTMDAEAILSRESNICFMPICGVIDNSYIRREFSKGNEKARIKTREAILKSREKIFELLLEGVKIIGNKEECNCKYDLRKEKDYYVNVE